MIGVFLLTEDSATDEPGGGRGRRRSSVPTADDRRSRRRTSTRPSWTSAHGPELQGFVEHGAGAGRSRTTSTVEVLGRERVRGRGSGSHFDDDVDEDRGADLASSAVRLRRRSGCGSPARRPGLDDPGARARSAASASTTRRPSEMVIGARPSSRPLLRDHAGPRADPRPRRPALRPRPARAGPSARDEAGRRPSTASVEGDARRVELAYEATLTEEDRASRSRTSRQPPSPTDDLDGACRRSCSSSSSSSTTTARSFVQALGRRRGQRRGRPTFCRDPPTTSEEILEPDTFLSGACRRRDLPAPEADGEPSAEGVIGQFTLDVIWPPSTGPWRTTDLPSGTATTPCIWTDERHRPVLRPGRRSGADVRGLRGQAWPDLGRRRDGADVTESSAAEVLEVTVLPVSPRATPGAGALPPPGDRAARWPSSPIVEEERGLEFRGRGRRRGAGRRGVPPSGSGRTSRRTSRGGPRGPRERRPPPTRPSACGRRAPTRSRSSASSARCRLARLLRPRDAARWSCGVRRTRRTSGSPWSTS